MNREIFAGRSRICTGTANWAQIQWIGDMQASEMIQLFGAMKH